jgi:gluconolactonase
VSNRILKLALVALTAAGLGTRTFSRQAETVEGIDPAIDALIARDAKVEPVATGPGFTWTEGPVWTRANTLLFAEIPSNSIQEWSPKGGTRVFIKPSGYKGKEPFGGKEPGTNGMTLDRTGRLTVAGHGQRDVWRLESLDPKAQQTVLADTYQGKRLNSPNDLTYKSDGSLYFTDPPYGLPTQSDDDKHKELKVNGVYRLQDAVSQKPGAEPAHDKLTLLISDLTRPNGIAFSPDEKYLYISNSAPKKFWMRYTVKQDGTVGDGKLLADATDDKADGAPDGMKVDRNGNLYSAAPGGIWVFSAAGKHIGTIRVPERTGNLAWGDADGKTMYIAGSSHIYRVRVKVGGIKP